MRRFFELLYGPPGWNARRKLALIMAGVGLVALAVRLTLDRGAAPAPGRPAPTRPAELRVPGSGFELPGTPPRPAADSGLLVVVADHHGRAIGHAEVEVAALEAGPSHPAGTSQAADRRSKGTDSDGRASFASVQAGGTYSVHVTAEGYEPVLETIGIPAMGAIELPIRLVPLER